MPTSNQQVCPAGSETARKLDDETRYELIEKIWHFASATEDCKDAALKAAFCICGDPADFEKLVTEQEIQRARVAKTRKELAVFINSL